MQDEINDGLVQAVRTNLADCEDEISALAHESLSPAIPAERRAEVLMQRAKMQTRSVSLSRQLQRLRLVQDALDQISPDAAEQLKLHTQPRWRRRLSDRFMVQDFSRAS